MVNKDCVGASPSQIGKMAGLVVPEGTRFIIVKINSFGNDEYLSKEKLCPVICIAEYGVFDQCIENAKLNLLNEGIGHSVVIHSHNESNIEKAAVALPVSRVGVNMIGSSGLGGSLDNGLKPAATLGCGTWGNNSISENLWWTHLVNITQVAYRNENAVIPTNEEIWN